MASEFTPDEVRHARFRTSLRGLDRTEVEAFLDGVAARIEHLQGERERLRSQLADSGAQDLESEFENIGREVANILQAAREAAEAMRERASLDATRWRSESMADAEEKRRSAAADAEAMRRDAWAAGTELLEQTETEATRMRREAERDVLTIMGEAEREAHRLTSGARRESDDLIRNASMDAEKTMSEAERRRDDIIEQANRQAAAAQERTRALEERRDELLVELENVRTTLTRLEGSLEERRESLDLTTESPSVKVVPAPSDAAKTWQPGETVRVVQSEKTPFSQGAEESEAYAEELEPPLTEESTRDFDMPVPELLTPEPRPDPGPSVASAAETAIANEVDALFASLRGGATVETTSPPAPIPPRPEKSSSTTTDWIEERDARLLPITNRALRGVKKAVTELQNVALDSLRTDEEWLPEADAISDAVRAELTTVWSEAFAAGHAVAEEMTGERLKRPRTPRSSIVKDFGVVLGGAVASALEDAGEGQRERQSAASKVYRVWRTDEAERRIREAAIDAFERAIEGSIPTEAPVG